MVTVDERTEAVLGQIRRRVDLGPRDLRVVLLEQRHGLDAYRRVGGREEKTVVRNATQAEAQQHR